MRDSHKIITICDNLYRKFLAINVKPLCEIIISQKNVYHIYKVLIIVSIIREEKSEERSERGWILAKSLGPSL